MDQYVEVIDAGVIEYGAAWRQQQGYFDALLSRKSGGDAELSSVGSARDIVGDRRCVGVLMLCEHPHVYTLGRSGCVNNLLVNDTFLESIGATYFKTDRGGDITYHGYGQAVGYPILDIEALGLSLKEYVWTLEEAVIRVIAMWGISGARLAGATGVWIEGQRKICAIGVKASRYVTMHGFALNVTTDLNYFSHINPCGFVDKGVTSIAAEVARGGCVNGVVSCADISDRDLCMKMVKEQFVRVFADLIHAGIKTE